MKTFKATYARGGDRWHATLRDETRLAAARRFRQMARGARFWFEEVGAEQHSVFGSDADEDYEDGE